MESLLERSINETGEFRLGFVGIKKSTLQLIVLQSQVLTSLKSKDHEDKEAKRDVW